MPARNRYAFLLSQTGDVAKNVSSLYAQLQAPGQRKAVAESLNKSVKDSAPTVRTTPESVLVGERIVGYFKNSYGEQEAIREPVFETVYNAVTVPAANPVAYSQATANAAAAAYGSTINPVDLARLPGTNFNAPGYIANAYINPVAEEAYNLLPQFNSSGQQQAGIGTRLKSPTATERIFSDLESGPLAKLARYKTALSDATANANFAATYTNNAARDFRNQNYYERPISNSGYDPDYTYNLQRSQGQFFNYPIYNGPVYNGLPGYVQQQFAELQKSQTGLSQSFYGGGHDSPKSFPTGYRL